MKQNRLSLKILRPVYLDVTEIPPAQPAYHVIIVNYAMLAGAVEFVILPRMVWSNQRQSHPPSKSNVARLQKREHDVSAQ
jgi:hypothetical protein